MTKGFVVLRNFTVISLTGASCSLNCFYCSAKYISSMEPVITPEGLEKLVTRAVKSGVKGLMVSGGFTADGKLPLRKFVPTLRKLKREYDLVLNVHPGLQDRETIAEMKDVFDVVDYEFAVTRSSFEAKGMKGRSREEVVEVAQAMVDEGLDVVPHVMLAHPGDTFEEEVEALKLAFSLKPRMVNLLVYIPTRGTRGEPVRPSLDLDQVVELVRASSSMGETGLGCMRPFQWKARLDRAVKGYVTRIANPAVETEELYDACCSLPEKLLPRFRVR